MAANMTTWCCSRGLWCQVRHWVPNPNPKLRVSGRVWFLFDSKSCYELYCPHLSCPHYIIHCLIVVYGRRLAIFTELTFILTHIRLEVRLGFWVRVWRFQVWVGFGLGLGLSGSGSGWVRVLQKHFALGSGLLCYPMLDLACPYMATGNSKYYI